VTSRLLDAKRHQHRAVDGTKISSEFLESKGWVALCL